MKFSSLVSKIKLKNCEWVLVRNTKMIATVCQYATPCIILLKHFHHRGYGKKSIRLLKGWYSKYSWNSNWETYSFISRKHMSHFQIYFRKNQYITMDRNELFGITDFLANFGGLLGLFIGFSLLSLKELLYYFSLRIICNIKLFGKRNWSGKNE